MAAAFANDPGFIGKDVQRYRSVTTKGVNATAKSTLDLGARVIFKVEPKVEPKPDKPAEKKKPSKKKEGAK